MSDEKELTEEQLEDAAGGRKIKRATLQNEPSEPDTGGGGGGVFTGRPGRRERGDELDPPSMPGTIYE